MTTARQGKGYSLQIVRPSLKGWALLLLAIIAAAGLRFWQLGDIPPGLYRDEALNGLDAVEVLAGTRAGESPFYFAANNGREPAYIYLTALSISLLGQTTLAVRLAAAVTGTLTTWFTYKLAASWFNRRVGYLSALLWAITLWPIHLSRIGLRPVLLPLMMTLTLWLGTLAYRKRSAGRPAAWLWLAAGLAYGATFYTYLPVRFTPLFLVLFIGYLILTGRGKGLWPGMAWSAVGALIMLAPLILLAVEQPELILGRSGQVSVLNPAINQGRLLATLWESVWRALAMFFVEGDAIVRHNPPGRAVFDLFMAVPFMAGLVWCLRHWRKPAAMALLLWVGVMLGPTILAEDSPHFLRAAGILPAALIFPAIGLSELWAWTKLPSRWRKSLVVFLLAASTLWTVRDYFWDYGQADQTAYWFDGAARDLAQEINGEPAATTVYADRRFWDGWPSVRYLLSAERPVTWYRVEEALPEEIDQPAALYAWPYEQLDGLTNAIRPPALVTGETGSLVQGDLEPAAYSLYNRYTAGPLPELPILANFDNTIQLRDAGFTELTSRLLQVDLYWSTDSVENRAVVVYIHIVDKGNVESGGASRLAGQSDSVPAGGTWPSHWWRPGLIIRDRHIIEMEEDSDRDKQQIEIGLYDASTREKLVVVDASGNDAGDFWLLQP